MIYSEMCERLLSPKGSAQNRAKWIPHFKKIDR